VKESTEALGHPRLRFPEYRDAAHWKYSSLGAVASFHKGRGVSKADIDPDGSRPCIRYGELYTRYTEVIGEVHSRTSLPDAEVFLSKPNDVIVPASGETKEDIATASCVLLGGIALGGDLNVIRSEQSGPFISYSLNGPLKRRIAKLAQGDTVVHLYPSQLEGLRVAFPELPEQDKVAGCLISLEAVISAQGRKVEALKTYKRELIQQLFPRKGESYPRLRLPPFRDTERWSQAALGLHASKIGSGSTPLGGDRVYTTEGRPFVRSQNIGWGSLLLDGVAHIDDDIHFSFAGTEIQLNDVLLNITGASIGRSAIADRRIIGGNVNQHVCIIRTDETSLNSGFLNQYLLSDFGQTQIGSFQAGGNRQGLNFEQIRALQVPLPPTLLEQAQIAALLMPLDHSVLAGEEMLNQLKTHKKGLIQGLFPATVNSQ
jgi:type I restriction enzyme S subunit